MLADYKKILKDFKKIRYSRHNCSFSPFFERRGKRVQFNPGTKKKRLAAGGFGLTPEREKRP